MSLRQLVEAVFNEFTTQYNIRDFPTLYDVLAVNRKLSRMVHCIAKTRARSS